MKKQLWKRAAIITLLLTGWSLMQAQESQRTLQGVVKDPNGKWVG